MGIDVETEKNTNEYASNGLPNVYWKGKIQKTLPDGGLKVKRRRKRSVYTSPKKDKPRGINGFKKGNRMFLY